MKKLIPLLAVLLLLLAGCADPGGEPTTEVPTTEAPTVPTTEALADIGGTLLTPDTQVLDLTVMAYDLDALVTAAGELPEVQTIELGVTELTFQQVEAIRQAYPNAEVRYSAVKLLGMELSPDTVSLDLYDMDPNLAEEAAAHLPLLTGLEEINFVREETCVFDLSNIHLLDLIREAVPEVMLRVRFELFGQVVTSETERIEYYLVEIGNEGAETVRAVLPYLKSCTYFLMDGCGVDNEILAQLREDFPQTKIVWRIWLAGPFYGNQKLTRRASMLTDTKLIRTVVVTDKTSYLLGYCNETKYMDLGHNPYLSNCDFVAKMPDLEAAILGLTDISDISPLANCKNLEYLELFSCKVSDLSPLASCTNLKHLNVSNLPGVTDLTPLYALTKLERYRGVMNDQISKEQMDALAAALPQCTILDRGWDPTENGWRTDEYGNYVPRYALLREQMEYDLWAHA